MENLGRSIFEYELIRKTNSCTHKERVFFFRFVLFCLFVVVFCFFVFWGVVVVVVFFWGGGGEYIISLKAIFKNLTGLQ